MSAESFGQRIPRAPGHCESAIPHIARNCIQGYFTDLLLAAPGRPGAWRAGHRRRADPARAGADGTARRPVPEAVQASPGALSAILRAGRRPGLRRRQPQRRWQRQPVRRRAIGSPGTGRRSRLRRQARGLRPRRHATRGDRRPRIEERGRGPGQGPAEIPAGAARRRAATGRQGPDAGRLRPCGGRDRQGIRPGPQRLPRPAPVGVRRLHPGLPQGDAARGRPRPRRRQQHLDRPGPDLPQVHGWPRLVRRRPRQQPRRRPEGAFRAIREERDRATADGGVQHGAAHRGPRRPEAGPVLLRLGRCQPRQPQGAGIPPAHQRGAAQPRGDEPGPLNPSRRAPARARSHGPCACPGAPPPRAWRPPRCGRRPCRPRDPGR
ncbi:LigA [Paracidovorax citrulli AAC00-1]|uniref:LigA n=1 Tax=Paracidovorax citrulli (strain AAC00-1) TaxID=397945 RepID=A1TV92_PARC0|nr:LigA [Paracidovorax citrulli AAC00-1]